MARIAVVTHNEEVGEGRLAAHLDGHDVDPVRAASGEFPERAEAAVILGGFMGAYETDLHPWLALEQEWLKRLVAEDVPVLGICLGSQMIAAALGGRAFRAPRPEVGVVEIEVTPAGRRHPVIAHIGPRAFLAHQDTFDLPPEASLLATTAEFPLAFQVGTALGIQSHPEVPTTQAVAWPDHPEFSMLERGGISRAEFIRQVRQHDTELEAAAGAMFGAWFEAIT